MIATLLTPLMIATASIRIDVDTPKYDHQLQKNEVVAYRQATYSGTQTFDVSGRPWDADND